MPVCVTSTCVISICAMSSCVMSVCVCVCVCVVSICVMSICVMSSCVTSIFVMSICVVSICVISICVMSTCAMSICVMSSCVTSIFVMSICAMSSYVMSVCVCVMSICVVSVCVMSIGVMSICVISTCVMSTCVMSSCVMSSCVTSIFVMSICAMSSCVMSVCKCVMSICVVSVCVMSICVMPICVHSYPERNLHTARHQTRMPARHPHTIFAPPIGTAAPNAIYTQQAAKPACQEDIDAKFSQFLLAQLPRTQFTHSAPPNPHASRTSTQIFAAPIGTATPNAIYTEHAAKPACSRTSTQNFRTSYWHSYPERNLHTASRQTRMPGRHQHAKAAAERRSPNDAKAYIRPPAVPPSRKAHACHAKVQRPARRPANTKAYIRPRADAASPTPATQKSSGQRGGPRTPKRTSDPVQMQQVPRLPRKSPAASAAAREHQSVHQTPCRCSKSHACHAKVQRPPHRPANTKAYIRPRADAASPGPHACHAKVQRPARRPANTKAYIRPRADAASPTPANQKSSSQRGGPRTPKRTSDPLQMPQSPRLPRKSPAASAAAREHQSVHQTPCRCSKSHACHAKVQRPARRPANTKAYIRPPADAASPTPATQKDSGICDVKQCDVKLYDVKLCDVKLCDVKLCDVKLCHVNLRDVKLCDVNLCDVKLCDVKLCDVNLCDVKLCDVKLCDVKLCDVSCVMSSCVTSSCVMSNCVTSICVMSICQMSICVMSICVTSICVMSICVTSICVMSICVTSIETEEERGRRRRTEGGGANLKTRTPHNNVGKNISLVLNTLPPRLAPCEPLLISWDFWPFFQRWLSRKPVDFVEPSIDLQKNIK